MKKELKTSIGCFVNKVGFFGTWSMYYENLTDDDAAELTQCVANEIKKNLYYRIIKHDSDMYTLQVCTSAGIRSEYKDYKDGMEEEICVDVMPFDEFKEMFTGPIKPLKING